MLKLSSTLLLLSSITVIGLFSCRKSTTEKVVDQNILQSTHEDIKFGVNGIKLSDAEKIAVGFLQEKHGNFLVKVRNANTITHDGKPYFHVINTNGGFVILSPDSMYRPIIAYDSINNFTFLKDNLNPGLVKWMNKHAHELDFVRSVKNPLTDTIGKENKALWKAYNTLYAVNNTSTPGKIINSPEPYPSLITSYSYSHSSIGPLLPVVWGQNYPFNYYCPLTSGAGLIGYNGRTPVGCVPVAMGQIVRYWQYPAWWNFSVMPLNKYEAGTGTGYQSMATMLKDMGSLAGTTYNDDASGTSMDNVTQVFMPLLGYTSALMTSNVAYQAWSGAVNGIQEAGLLESEIRNYYRPCILAGSEGIRDPFGIGIWQSPLGERHAWVCDGSDVITITTTYTYTWYSQESWGWLPHTQVTTQSGGTQRLLHMNWGWGYNGLGLSQGDIIGVLINNDGWYDCGVNYTNASSNSPDFTYFQEVIYGIYP